MKLKELRWSYQKKKKSWDGDTDGQENKLGALSGSLLDLATSMGDVPLLIGSYGYLAQRNQKLHTIYK